MTDLCLNLIASVDKRSNTLANIKLNVLLGKRELRNAASCTER
jgi:hypothetical protein